MRCVYFLLPVIALLLVACSDDGGGTNQNENQNQNSSPTCGNGEVELGEQCDDGSANSDSLPNACRTDCRVAWCGDGVTDAGELCDDGNTGNDDGCLTACNDAGDCCVVNVCGDGHVNAEPGPGGGPVEVCDDGNTADDLICRGDCKQDMTRCGDGALDQGEECDDAGSNSDTVADACRTSCTPAHCGDNVVDTGEVCDDGAANSDLSPDACRSDCQPSRCGDNLADTGEACDGPDLAGQSCTDFGYVDPAGLGCTPQCMFDSSACTPICGNGTTEPGEECDDGAANSDTTPNACRTSCLLPACGDGVKDIGEICDTADLGGSDCTDLGYAAAGNLGCLAGCFFDVTGCGAVCGNGTTEPGEQCDDGASNSDTAPDACRTNCAPARCGDGVKDTSEACDSADLGGQSCSDFGYVDPAGLACNGVCGMDTTGCNPVCGNGAIEPGELCDDQNTANVDGCSAACSIEARFGCVGEPSVCSCIDYFYGVGCAQCRVYVDGDSSITVRDGKSWATAYARVQDAIDQAFALFNPCEVWVAQGTYNIYESSSTDTVQLRAGVEVYGGFVGVETARTDRDPTANPTVLDGHDVAATSRVYHVVTGADNAVLDGFTITGGQATGTSPHDQGGGMWIDATAPTVRNCVFVANEAVDGGAVYVQNSAPLFDSCRFDSNVADIITGEGGAVRLEYADATFTDCLFVANSANRGGGIASFFSGPSLSGCVLDGNSATGNGGGLYHAQPASLQVTSTLFVHNSAVNGGGAHTSWANAQWVDCVFAGNTASSGGGGLWAFTGTSQVSQTVFTANTAIIGGGFNAMAEASVSTNCYYIGNQANVAAGVRFQSPPASALRSAVIAGNVASLSGGIETDNSPVTFSNVTVFGNDAGNGSALWNHGTSFSPSFANSVFWANNDTSNPIIYNQGPNPDATLDYCDAQGGYPGTGNINVDPSFAAPPSPGSNWNSVTYDAATWQTVLTDNTATWTPGALANRLVRPTAADSRWLLIVDNTATAIRVWGNMTGWVGATALYLLQDLRLGAGSACIDVGDDDAAPITDLDGNPRYDDLSTPNGGAGYSDLGSYEYQ